MLFKYLNIRKLPCTKTINGTDYVFGDDGLCNVNNKSDAKVMLNYPDLFEVMDKEPVLDQESDNPIQDEVTIVRRRGRPRLTE
jgi:hypothetical protein